MTEEETRNLIADNYIMGWLSSFFSTHGSFMLLRVQRKNRCVSYVPRVTFWTDQKDVADYARSMLAYYGKNLVSQYKEKNGRFFFEITSAHLISAIASGLILWGKNRKRASILHSAVSMNGWRTWERNRKTRERPVYVTKRLEELYSEMQQLNGKLAERQGACLENR